MSVDQHQFKFTGKFGELFWLVIKNTLLTMCTLGLYIPYARTNMRKYIWKSTKLEGHPFVFHADPKNLLKGYLLLAGIAVVSFVTVVMGSAMFPLFAPVFTLIPGILIFAFALRVRYTGYCYLVNNTSYRSIRFEAKKDAAWEFIGASFKGAFLTVLTLGLYAPCAMANLTRIKLQNTSYGNISLKFEMSNWDYALHTYKRLFFCLITFGIYIPWSIASKHKFLMSHLTFMGAKVESSVTGGGLIWLYVKSVVLLVCSLGLAAPYIMNMGLAYFLDNLCLKGSIDLDEIIQGAAQKPDHSLSDTIADALDVDVDVA